MSYFTKEAAKAEALGAHHVACVFAASAHVVWLAPRLAAQIRNWPADLAASGLAFRLNAGFHALMRSGRASMLRQLADRAEGAMPGSHMQYEFAVAEALTGCEDELLNWLARPTQTNEVGRIAGLMGVLSELDARHALQTEMLELGASAGLNLNLAHYSFELGTRRFGMRDSDVRIAPVWRGQSLPDAQPSIIAARGVDLAPVIVARAEDRERLFAYTWPGMVERTNRLSGAIAIADANLPDVTCGSAGPWLKQQLAVPQPEGTRRVVFHSMVMQYVPALERAAIARTMDMVGRAATPDRPLARVALEWREDRSEVDLRLTLWDGTTSAPREWLVATCHPYAEWFDWRGLA